MRTCIYIQSLRSSSSQKRLVDFFSQVIRRSAFLQRFFSGLHDALLTIHHPWPSFFLSLFSQVDAVRDPEGTQAEVGIPGALTAEPEPQWEGDAQRILELLGLRGQR